MTFICTWLNELTQFGTTDITLIVEDGDGVIPTQRVDKSYPEALVDEPFLTSEAEDEVERIVMEWNSQ